MRAPAGAAGAAFLDQAAAPNNRAGPLTTVSDCHPGLPRSGKTGIHEHRSVQGFIVHAVAPFPPSVFMGPGQPRGLGFRDDKR
jgi:hypothetical protein